MKPIFLRDSEAREWKIGTVVIEREHKRPDFSIKHVDKRISKRYALTKVVDKWGKEHAIYSPSLHPNDKVAVKETWENVNKPGIAPEYVYKSDYDDAELSECKNDGGTWHSPVTMPSDAVRHFATVRAVDAVERDGKWFWRITMEATQ